MSRAVVGTTGFQFFCILALSKKIINELDKNLFLKSGPVAPLMKESRQCTWCQTVGALVRLLHMSRQMDWRD
jgi:hypothetical protein